MRYAIEVLDASSGSCLASSSKAWIGRGRKEGKARFAAGLAQDEQCEFAEVIVAPHRTFAVGDLLASRDVVPVVWAMVDGVEQQTLVSGVGAEVGLIEQRAGYGEGRLRLASALRVPTLQGEVIPETEQTLGGDGGRGAVDRFPRVVGV